MSEESLAQGAPIQDAARLRQLRKSLLRLHKALLDDERAAYERVHGQVSAGELLQLVINHEQFAWLHAVSELVVRMDELLEVDEGPSAEEVSALVAETRQLLTPSETGAEFERRYYAALQREPDVVMAHREATRLLAN